MDKLLSKEDRDGLAMKAYFNRDFDAAYELYKDTMRENEQLRKERDFFERAHIAKYHDLVELTKFVIEKGINLSELHYPNKHSEISEQMKRDIQGIIDQQTKTSEDI